MSTPALLLAAACYGWAGACAAARGDWPMAAAFACWALANVALCFVAGR